MKDTLTYKKPVTDALYRNPCIIKCCCYGVAVVMTSENVLSVLDIAFLACFYHFVLKGTLMIGTAFLILKYILISLSVVFCNVNFHQLV